MSMRKTKVEIHGPILMHFPIDNEDHEPLKEVILIPRNTMIQVSLQGTPREVLQAVCDEFLVRLDQALNRESEALRVDVRHSTTRAKVVEELLTTTSK